MYSTGLYCIYLVCSLIVFVVGKPIEDYVDGANYEEMIEIKDNIPLKNLDSSIETSFNDEKPVKIKRSDGIVLENVQMTNVVKNAVPAPSNENLDEDNYLMSLAGLKELDSDIEKSDTREKRCGCDCKDYSYLKTFPPCCATTCCAAQVTCPARGLPSPMPGSQSM